MATKTSIKSGGWENHNQKLNMRSSVKAGGVTSNHNQRVRVITGARGGIIAIL